VTGVSEDPVALDGVAETDVLPELSVELVPYVKVIEVVAKPRALTEPLRVALVAVTFVALFVVTEGAGVVVKFKVELVVFPASLVASALK
jgi:hypothetical protein